MSLAFESIHQLVSRLRNKELSSRELTDLYIERIEKHDSSLNAVVVRDFENARQAADRADAATSRDESLGALHGMPFTIKEAYDVEGLPTTWGIPEFAQNIAARDADTVQKLRAAGAHLLGKTNVPQGLADFQSYNEIYGTTSNPWDETRTPGGSSGGSAVSLAAGFAAFEAGSDIGGSIRSPSHFCGVYGHKPTWGIVPQDGHALPGAPAPTDLAVVGPMARSADDLALLLGLTSGPAPAGAPAWRLTLPEPRQRRLSDFRVALWPDDPEAPVGAAIADRVQMVGDRLARLGAKVSDRARPAFTPKHSNEIYSQLVAGATSTGLPDAVFEAMQKGAQGLDPSDPGVWENPATASMLRITEPHRSWLQANHRRAELRAAWRAFFEEWDILLCPQITTTAFPHDHTDFMGRTITVDGNERPYSQMVFWAGLITVAYLPSTVFPTGCAEDGLPIGLQAASAEFQDATCIEFARLIAEELGGFAPPPRYAA